MKRLVLIFQCLIQYTKGHPSFEKRQVLSLALRNSRVFIEMFLKKMKTLEKLFNAHQRGVVEVIKELQTATRQLQNVAAHGKILRDPSMAKEVPAIKKALESLIISAKAMAEANNCLEAVWVGNLKHRDITGAEVQAVEEEEDSVSGSSSEEDGDAVDKDVLSSKSKQTQKIKSSGACDDETITDVGAPDDEGDNNEDETEDEDDGELLDDSDDEDED